MSIEQVAKFWQEIREDEGLRQKLAAVETTDTDGLVRAVAAVAGERGYDVTQSDLRQLMEAGQGNAPSNLDDSQLDTVAGGVCKGQNFSYSTFNSIESGLHSMNMMDTSFPTRWV